MVGSLIIIIKIELHSRKSYVILMGGQAKCLVLMTRGEVEKPTKSAYVIHNDKITFTIKVNKGPKA